MLLVAVLLQRRFQSPLHLDTSSARVRSETCAIFNIPDRLGAEEIATAGRHAFIQKQPRSAFHDDVDQIRGLKRASSQRRRRGTKGAQHAIVETVISERRGPEGVCSTRTAESSDGVGKLERKEKRLSDAPAELYSSRGPRQAVQGGSSEYSLAQCTMPDQVALSLTWSATARALNRKRGVARNGAPLVNAKCTLFTSVFRLLLFILIYIYLFVL